MAVAAVWGAGAVCLLILGVLITSSGETPAGRILSLFWGWLLPIGAGLLAARLAWRLTRGGRRSGPSGAVHTECRCPSCGGPVFSEWRLCPHCGALLESDDLASLRDARSVAH